MKNMVRIRDNQMLKDYKEKVLTKLPMHMATLEMVLAITMAYLDNIIMTGVVILREMVVTMTMMVLGESVIKSEAYYTLVYNLYLCYF
ncbi:hypothetical protein AQUCO_03000122v1 [Aquilegia coerulea]|uniref:Uncharacterized protein n=1 Tax=Aquilegia coerulea TaxID=218851 RepID=A0A2G5D1A6_AQUCA|nr:hypothetical protein AQUCO_03000122v1 [Aquilegia coerulea]